MRVTVSVFIEDPLAYGRETIEIVGGTDHALDTANKAKITAAYEAAIQSALKLTNTGPINVSLHKG